MMDRLSEIVFCHSVYEMLNIKIIIRVKNKYDEWWTIPIRPKTQ